VVAALLFLHAVAAVAAPSVDEIIDRHVAARGGYGKIASLRSLIIRGEYREGEHV
jgi:hypothetical protein